ncbi:MAG: hypothetical protein H0Z33_15875 [Bacillaceae bacterium]|nr:hypothetical protein [Bacillaceae bacterium]
MDQKVTKIKIKITVITILLILLFIIYSLVLVPEDLAFKIGLLLSHTMYAKLYNPEFYNAVSITLLTLSAGAFINYIYKFFHLYLGVRHYQKGISRDEKLIKKYLIYSKTNILAILFYSTTLVIYIFIYVTL